MRRRSGSSASSGALWAQVGPAPRANQHRRQRAAPPSAAAHTTHCRLTSSLATAPPPALISGESHAARVPPRSPTATAAPALAAVPAAARWGRSLCPRPHLSPRCHSQRVPPLLCSQRGLPRRWQRRPQPCTPGRITRYLAPTPLKRPDAPPPTPTRATAHHRPRRRRLLRPMAAAVAVVPPPPPRPSPEGAVAALLGRRMLRRREWPRRPLRRPTRRQSRRRHRRAEQSGAPRRRPTHRQPWLRGLSQGGHKWLLPASHRRRRHTPPPL